jgi:hypothetical protein
MRVHWTDTAEKHLDAIYAYIALDSLKKPTVYIESSFISYLVSRPSRDVVSEVSRIVESCGFECPQICSPEELGGNAND